MPEEYIHDYFTMDTDAALSHAAANLNRVHREVEGWDMNREDFSLPIFSLPIQDWLLELTEAVSFLGALTKAQRQEIDTLQTSLRILERYLAPEEE